MRDEDEMVNRKLRTLVENHHLDIESDLRAVLDRARGPERRRRWIRTAVAVTAAFALSIPVLAAGYVVGRESRGRLQAQVLGSRLSPEQSIPGTWGGTLLWGIGERDVSAETSDASWALPSDLHGGIVSPNGPEGGVYTFHGEVPPGDFPAIWYPDGRTVDVKLPFSDSYDLTLPSWSPDGQRLASEICHTGDGGNEACSVLLISPPNGASDELVPSNSQGVSWSPDGSQIAFIGRDRALTVVDVASGATRTLLPLKGFTDLLRPAWSPSGKLIAVIARDGDDYVPLILSLDGTILGKGNGAAGSPPKLAWRQRMDTLLVAQEVFGADATVLTTVSQMSSPDWSTISLMRLQGQGRPELWSSPDGKALLLESQDQGILGRTAGAEGIPYKWTVLEVDTGTIDQWELTNIQILDWR